MVDGMELGGLRSTSGDWGGHTGPKTPPGQGEGRGFEYGPNRRATGRGTGTEAGGGAGATRKTAGRRRGAGRGLGGNPKRLPYPLTNLGTREVGLYQPRAELGIYEPGTMTSGHLVKCRGWQLLDQGSGTVRGKVGSIGAPDEHHGN